MKALTLWQPWASLVIVGAKQFETRSWPAPQFLRYEGEFAIHAAARIPPDARQACFEEPFLGAWTAALRDNQAGQFYADDVLRSLPLGAVLGTVRLRGCFAIGEGERHYYGGTVIPPSPPELWFGDYRPNRWAWRLEVVERFAEPVSAVGRQRLWDWADPRR